MWKKFPSWHPGLRAMYCTSYPQSNACAPQTGKGELDKELTVAHADTVFKPRNQT